MSGTLPADKAMGLILEAENDFYIGREFDAANKLDLALLEQGAIALYKGNGWKANRRVFADVLARAYLLSRMFGDREHTQKIYTRLILWSDQPSEAQRLQLERIMRDWNKRDHNLLVRIFPGLKRLLVIMRKFFRNTGVYAVQNHRLLP